MTGALVSGQAGVAVFLDGSQAWCVRPHSTSIEPVSQGLLPYLFEDIHAANYYADATLASARELLEQAWVEERGLHLTLISMDPDTSDSTRELAEEALEEFLEHSHVSEFIENRLYAERLPEGVAWRAELVADAPSARPRVDQMKRSVTGAQEAIGRVRAAWNTLPNDLFLEFDEQARFERVLVETGAFRLLAGASAKLVRGDEQLQLLSDVHYRTFANFRNILLEWSRAISLRTGLLQAFNSQAVMDLPERVRELGSAATSHRLQEVIDSQRTELTGHRDMYEREATRYHSARLIASGIGVLSLIVALVLFLSHLLAGSAACVAITLIIKAVEMVFYKTEREAHQRARTDVGHLEDLNWICHAMELASSMGDEKERNAYRQRILAYVFRGGLPPANALKQDATAVKTLISPSSGLWLILNSGVDSILKS